MMKSKPKLLCFLEAMSRGAFSYIVRMTNGMVDRFDISIAYAVIGGILHDIVLVAYDFCCSNIIVKKVVA